MIIMQKEIITFKTSQVSKKMKILHFTLYFWIYILQATFAVHFGQIANYYFIKTLNYSWDMLAWINFLVYLPLIIKPWVYQFMQKKTSFVHLQKLLFPFTGIYLLTTILTGMIKPNHPPILMIIAVLVMQLSLVPVDLSMDSYFLVQYSQHSIGISLMQILSGIIGSQIVYFLVARFTSYFSASSWLTYYILLGLISLPVFILGFIAKPKTVTVPAKDYSSLKELPKDTQKLLIWLLVFLVGINVTYLSGTIIDIFLPERFGAQAYVDQIGRISQLWGILGIGIMILFSLKPGFFKKMRFVMLYFIGIEIAAYFIAMVYAPLEVFMVFQIMSVVLTYVFRAIYLSLMLDAIPKSVLPPFYQVCAMVFAITHAVFEPLGVLIAFFLDVRIVILLTAGLMLLNIPILVIFSRMLKKNERAAESN